MALVLELYLLQVEVPWLHTESLAKPRISPCSRHVLPFRRSQLLRWPPFQWRALSLRARTPPPSLLSHLTRRTAPDARRRETTAEPDEGAALRSDHLAGVCGG